MPGWLTDGVPQLNQTTGAETFNLDTYLANGASPQMASTNLAQLAQLISFYGNGLDKTMVAGTIYYTSINIGFPATFTGASVRVGTTGGTDNWYVALYNSAGVNLAKSAATLAGTASTWQQIAFTATYTLTTPGTYLLALQSNGTTAKFDSVNAPTSGTLITGSQTGSAGTLATISSVSTTYTANLGPRMLLY